MIESSQQLKVLVTGANSFIGFHVASCLLDRGRRVFATFRSEHPRIEVLRRAGAVLMRLDLAGENTLSELPASIDAIVHIAGVSASSDIQIDDMLACNVTGSLNILRYAAYARAQKIIYASSISVHGATEGLLDERTPTFAASPYGASKYMAERLFASEAIPCAAIRLPGVLGKGAHRAWLPTVAEYIKMEQPVRVYNPDQAFNNGVHVYDLSVLIDRIVELPWDGFHAFPIGASGSTTVAGAVLRLMAKLGKTTTIEFTERAQRGFVISSDYAAKQFNYKPVDILHIIDRYAKELVNCWR